MCVCVCVICGRVCIAARVIDRVGTASSVHYHIAELATLPRCSLAELLRGCCPSHPPWRDATFTPTSAGSNAQKDVLNRNFAALGDNWALSSRCYSCRCCLATEEQGRKGERSTLEIAKIYGLCRRNRKKRDRATGQGVGEGGRRGNGKREIPRDRQRKFSLFARRLRPSSFDESFPPSRDVPSREDERSTLRNRRDPTRRFLVKRSVVFPLCSVRALLECYTGNGIVIESYIDNLSAIRFSSGLYPIAMVCSGNIGSVLHSPESESPV